MEPLFNQLLPQLTALWWPFCRILAMFSAAPLIGEATLPMPVRVLLSLVLAMIMLPFTQNGAHIDPLSLSGVAATIEQALTGLVMGLSFHLAMAVIMVLGFLVSSQIGLSMALMNDPLNGASSDVVSGLLATLCALVFFAMDGHLLLVTVVGASFSAWPVGSGVSLGTLQAVSLNVAWVFSAALLLAIPMVFATFVVQIGFGFLNRVAPSLNLFSLGFALVTVFGLFMLGHIVRFVPQHYIRMCTQVLDMLGRQMKVVSHG
ncbi:flagellar biosynthetic protein FliR [Methyloversatilis thermotolerans]|uniref:flagellar biosynthetic protein FliR n=1 Tax=Methyloversatilis thermotolerans TaxID=1346290 RepID=UPI000381FC30|nr:flagellar biosynthetic protein FliR [Methyloversatilis thermotolerans]